MTRITATVAEELDEIIVGKIYKILSEETVKTPLQGYDGIRVKLEDVPTGELYGTMLWVRPEVGKRSKLGTFMDVLGYDTVKWVGKTIEVVSWSDKDREIKKLK